MYHFDLPDVKEENLGGALDTCERKLRNAIAKRDTAMETIEQSRHGSVQLSKDDYWMQKTIHGEAVWDVEKFDQFMKGFGRQYLGVESERWMREHHEMKI